MSKATNSYVILMIICVVMVLIDSADLVDFGGFATGFAFLVVLFGILTLRSVMKDMKAENG